MMNIYVVHDRTGNQSKRFDNCLNDARDYAEKLAWSEGLVMLLVCDENQNIQRRLMYSNYDGWYTRENEIDAIWETLYDQEAKAGQPSLAADFLVGFIEENYELLWMEEDNDEPDPATYDGRRLILQKYWFTAKDDDGYWLVQDVRTVDKGSRDTQTWNKKRYDTPLELANAMVRRATVEEWLERLSED